MLWWSLTTLKYRAESLKDWESCLTKLGDTKIATGDRPPAQKLRHREHDRRSPSPPSSEGLSEIRDHSYRYRYRTPSSESYSASSCQDRNRRGRRSSHRGMGNYAMSKAL